MNNELEVKTTAGILRAYESRDPGQPGIAIVFQPKGYEEEIDMSYVSVYQNEGYRTPDNERDTDVVILTYSNPYTEDYTQKDIIRREDIVDALKEVE